MKKLAILLALCLATLLAPAKSMTDIWNTMPQTLFPFLDHNHQLEMTEFLAMGIDGQVDNQLDGKSTMDTLTTDYIHVTLTETSTVEIKRMPRQGADSILCVVHTVGLPEGESTLCYYTQDWQPLPSPGLGHLLTRGAMPAAATPTGAATASSTGAATASSTGAATALSTGAATAATDYDLAQTPARFFPQLTVRPDTMSTTRYEELRAMLDPVLVRAALHADSFCITLSVSVPLLSRADAAAVAAILRPLTLRLE